MVARLTRIEHKAAKLLLSQHNFTRKSNQATFSEKSQIQIQVNGKSSMSGSLLKPTIYAVFLKIEF